MTKSNLQTQLIQRLDVAEEMYSLHFRALGGLYENVIKNPDQDIIFVHPGAQTKPWRPDMPADRVRQLATAVLSQAPTGALLHIAVNVYQFMFLLCAEAYKSRGGTETIDKYWFNFGMIEAVSGVKPESCARWETIDKLFRIRDICLYPQTPDFEEVQMIKSQSELYQYFKYTKEFAEDFELAVLGENPKIRI